MKYLVNIAVALGVGGLASLISNSDMKTFYMQFNQPALSPPMWLFPVVWSILYVLMAVGYTMVADKSPKAKKLYYTQLAFNFLWTIVFFKLNWFLFAFIWLIVLLVLVVKMAAEFWKVKPVAGYLQIPYILWLVFAGYLNFMVYWLNM